MDWLELRVFFIVAASLFWGLYFFNRYKADKRVLKKWGFRAEHFKHTFLFLLPYAVLLTTGIFWYGFLVNAEFFNWNLIPVLVLYPLWGIIQQFLVISIIAGNLKSISSLQLKNYQVVLLVSVLFSLVHSSSLPLMGFTFVMEMAFLVAYFRWQNIWPLGIYHGWLGSLFLFMVAGRDLWNELWRIF